METQKSIRSTSINSLKIDATGRSTFKPLREHTLTITERPLHFTQPMKFPTYDETINIQPSNLLGQLVMLRDNLPVHDILSQHIVDQLISSSKAVTRTEWIPYFYQPDYTTQESITRLTGNQLELNVGLAGVSDTEPIIYPFAEDEKRGFSGSLTLDWDYGTMTARWTPVGSLEITEVRQHGTLVPFSAVELPILVSYVGKI